MFVRFFFVVFFLFFWWSVCFLSSPTFHRGSLVSWRGRHPRKRGKGGQERMERGDNCRLPQNWPCKSHYSLRRTLCPYLAYLASTGYGSRQDNLVVRRQCFLVMRTRSIGAPCALYIYMYPRSIPTVITHDLALLENGVEFSGDSVITL